MSTFGIQPPPMWVGGARQFSDVAANSSSSPFGPPGQMNTQQRLDAHYGNMVGQFDASPVAAPQVQASSAQLPGAPSFGGLSPWGNKAPQTPAAGGGGGFLSKVASLFAGLF